MAYKNMTQTIVDDALLDEELLKSAQYWKVRISEHYLFYPRMLKTGYVPLADLTRAFIRVETVVSRVCCGPAEFHVYKIILCSAQGEIAAIEVDSETKADRTLAAIAKCGIPTGKPAEQ